MSMQEEEMNGQLKSILEMGREDKTIDVISLTAQILKNEEQNRVSQGAKRLAYFISLGFPPFGLIFAVKYYLSDKTDAKRVAHICVILTIVVSILTWLTLKMLVESSGVTTEQIQQINTSEIYDLLK